MYCACEWGIYPNILENNTTSVDFRIHEVISNSYKQWDIPNTQQDIL